MPKLGIIGLLAAIIVAIIVFALYTYTNSKTVSSEPFINEEVFNETNTNLNPQPTKLYTISETLNKAVTEFLGASGITSKDIKFEADPIPGWEKRNDVCYKASEPQFIPYRDPQQLNGCGWWFNEDGFDDNRASFSTMGNRKEPVNAKNVKESNPSGRWIWDLDEAQRFEARKICKRLKICEIADLMPGKCGFCPSLNMGVPINSDGQSLYPQDSDAACPDDVVTNPFKCPRPAGDTSAEKGQKFVRLICDPDPDTGKLNNQCLIRIAKALGAGEQGAIIKILKGDEDGYMNMATGINRHKFRIAKQYLELHENIVSQDAFFGYGVCSRYDAMYYYGSVLKTMYKGKHPDSRGAASFLIKGGNSFDECQKDANATGPFELHCVQRAALENGFQKSASMYPRTQSDMNKFSDKTWSQIKDYYKSKTTGLDSDDLQVRRQAAYDIYGLVVQSTGYNILEELGEITGLSYYIYEWTEKERAAPIYFGRQICESFPDFDNTQQKKEMQCKKIRSVKSLIRFKGQIVTDKVYTSKFWTCSDDGIKITANENIILNKWMPQSEPVIYESSEFNVDVKELGPTKFHVEWFNNSVEYKFYIRMKYKEKFYKVPEISMYQMQPMFFPIARWDFYQGTIDDRCGTLNSTVVGNLQTAMVDSKKCVIFNGRDNYIKINHGIHTSAFKGITMMVNLQKDPYGPFRFWEFCNHQPGDMKQYGNKCTGDMYNKDEIFSAITKNNIGMEFSCQKNKTGPKLEIADTLPSQQWTHLAWLIDDTTGLTMYINGEPVVKQVGPINQLKDKIFKYMYILHSNEAYDKEIAVAWFRIFDYNMTQAQVRLDMNNRFALSVAFPTDVRCGWL